MSCHCVTVVPTLAELWQDDVPAMCAEIRSIARTHICSYAKHKLSSLFRASCVDGQWLATADGQTRQPELSEGCTRRKRCTQKLN